jgi:hypothetical protein
MRGIKSGDKRKGALHASPCCVTVSSSLSWHQQMVLPTPFIAMTYQGPAAERA